MLSNSKKKALLCALLCTAILYPCNNVRAENEEVPLTVVAEKTDSNEKSTQEQTEENSKNSTEDVKEDNVFYLTEYMVTATRMTQDKKEVPASVEIISKEEIQAKNVVSIAEILKTKTGVYMGPKAQDDIMIRGFNSKDILVLVDGQPMNSVWNGVVNWEMIPVDRIEKVEVVRGAGSSLYGGHAVGAVISITTKENKKDTTVDMLLSYGSNNTWKKAISVDQKINEKLSIGISYENSSSDGYRGYYRTVAGKNPGNKPINYQANLPKLSNGNYIIGGRGEKTWENENYSFNVKYKFDDNKSLKYSYSNSVHDYSYNNPFSYVYDKNGNQVFKGNVLTQDGKLVEIKPGDYLGYKGKRESDLHILNYQDIKNKIQLNIGMNDTKKDGYSSASTSGMIAGINPGDINWSGAGTNSFYPSQAYNVDFQKVWENLGVHTIVAGANWKSMKFDQTRYNLANWKNHNSSTGIYEKHGGKGENMALFVQDEIKLSKVVKMYVGLRYDHYKKHGGYSQYFDAGILNNNKSKNHAEGQYNELSPKLAFEYKADSATNYYISYGHSFNPPLLYQTFRYGDNVWANPDLNPEISDSFEIGMKKELSKKTNLEVSLYHVKTKDKVAYITHYKPGTSTVDHKIYENAESEKRKGVELGLTHKFDKHWNSYINYAWQTGEVTNIKAATSTNYDIPKHILHAGIGYTKDKWKLNLDGQYISARQSPELENGEYGSEDAFFVMNAYINYQIAKGTTLQFGIENLLNREFYASEVAPERTYSVNVRYRF